MNYKPVKEEAIKEIRDTINRKVEVFHPTDQVDVFKGISDWAKDQAKSQTTHNEKYGVPDRANEDHD